MDYTLLGNSGLKVSRIALGTMSIGRVAPGMTWMVDEATAQPIFRQALDLPLGREDRRQPTHFQ
jgi:aryl-alcohol dehydrogenase-like predicted oxidoreductase